MRAAIAPERRPSGRQTVACGQLLGPVHGTVQTIRGMCSDQLDHEEIDGKLAELDDLVYETVELLGHGQG